MSRKCYTVRVNAPKGFCSTWDYRCDYFPRQFSYLKDAKAAAQEAIRKGATMARVEYPDMGELDFYPPKAK